MSYGLLYYLIGVADTVKNIAVALSFTTFVVYFLGLVVYTSFAEAGKEVPSISAKFIAATVLWVALLAAMITLLPKKKDMLIIAGLHMGTNSIDAAAGAVSEKLPKLNQLINQELDKLIDKE